MNPRGEFGKRMEWRRREGVQFKPLRRRWCLGSEEFRQELLAQVSELAGPEHRREDVLTPLQQNAECRMMNEESPAEARSGHPRLP